MVCANKRFYEPIRQSSINYLVRLSDCINDAREAFQTPVCFTENIVFFLVIMLHQ